MASCIKKSQILDDALENSCHLFFRNDLYVRQSGNKLTGIVGQAPVGGICKGYGASIVEEQAVRHETARAAAHELGHK